MSASNTTDLKPTYIYKIVPSSSPVPSPLPLKLPVSELDQSSGFIHLSTSVQVPGTLKHFFSNDDYVYLLRIPYDRVEKNIRWEDPKAEVCGPRGGEGMFPHLYNKEENEGELKLGSDEIESVKTIERNGKSWDEALAEAKDWLVY
ncbi:hypothetical protein K474DRAFT_322218 [Panus rudis PR-1116 ss-1]|nr:hypothetical protein K474DRAFT_322218 [Panus rudis PR-1116 ss-1]